MNQLDTTTKAGLILIVLAFALYIVGGMFIELPPLISECGVNTAC